jgi:hypothetical protein
MTVPTLMNCAHRGEGWCLACVGRLGAENARLRAALREAAAEVEALKVPLLPYDYNDGIHGHNSACDLCAGLLRRAAAGEGG